MGAIRFATVAMVGMIGGYILALVTVKTIILIASVF